MPQLSIAPGSTSVTVQVRILDKTKADGSGLTGLSYDTAGLTAYYNRERGASTQISLAPLAAADSAWSSGGFKEIDATNKPGEYRLDLPDAVLASGSRFATVTLRGASNMADCVLMIDLKNESSVVAITDGIITAAKFAANALDAVWSTSSRTLTSFGTLVADIWSALLTGITTAGSIGKLIKDNLDAAVSTRSTYAGADTAGTTTLLSRIGSAITITGGKVDVNDKTGFGLSSAALAAIENAVFDADYTIHDGATTFGEAIINILSNTYNLNADWANGGRLDQILDAVATASALAGAQAILDKVDEMIERYGDGWRYTAFSLTNAPSSGSGLTTDQAGTMADLKTMISGGGTANAQFTEKALEKAPSGTATLDPELGEAILNTYAIISNDANITVVSPVVEGNSIVIKRGYDYLSADNRSIELSSTNWPDLTNAASVALVQRDPDRTLWHAMEAITTGFAQSQAIRLELEDSFTAGLEAGKLPLRAMAVLENGDVVDLADVIIEVR